MIWGRLALLLGGAAVLAACSQRSALIAAPVAETPQPTMRIVVASPPPESTPLGTPASSYALEDRPRAFAKCSTCHTLVPGSNGIGPSLAGVYGRKAGYQPTFRYGAALAESGVVWDAATLDRYLANPKGMVPGTKMTFRGLDDPLARAEIIAYLQRH